MRKLIAIISVLSLSFVLIGCEEQTTTCDEGYELRGGVCYEVKVECEDGFELVEGECQEIVPECNEGYSLVDGECVEDIPECVLPETLVENVCVETHVLIPELVGQPYSDVLVWSFDNDINLNQSSEYTDDAEPGAVYFQEVEAGTYLEKESDLTIIYSRGYDPNGVIELPDLTGLGEDEIKEILEELNIGKYEFADSFSLDITEGLFVSYEVKKIGDHTEDLRRDDYTFYLSKGPIVIEDVNFNSPGTIRGVNLGGWFVLEGWMTPDLFTGVEGSDETEFMIQKENAAEVLENHWDTFITEEDFIWLKEHNVDYVRVPIPWWYKGGLAYEGTEYEVTYANSEFYLHRMMGWADTHGIKVLLDLHTAPWCQNGFDNGGMAGVFEWHKDQANVDLTVEVLEDIAQEFSGYTSLWGIELLNEPAWAVPYSVLLPFYEEAYDVVRAVNPDIWIGMHDGFRGYDWGTWTSFFLDNEFENVFFDMHLYHVFGDMWGDFDIHDHLRWIEIEQDKAIHRYDDVVPTIIGEWSLGLQGNVYDGLSQDSIKDVKIAFGNAQLNKFEESMGWFFWNYKIDQNYFLEWDMQRLVENGIFPDDFSDAEDASE